MHASVYSALQQLMAATAWPMTKPTGFGSFHLLWLFIVVPAAVFIAWKLRGLGEKGNRRLLIGIGLFLAVCEVYKQIFYFFYIENGSYPWGIFPFQLCSVPMYLCIIAPLLKKGKLQRGMYHFMVLFNLLGGLAAMIEISGLSHEYWTLTLHAFIWHTILLFIGLYLGFSRHTSVTKTDFKLACLTFIGLSVVAFSINVVIGQILGHEGINMFFVGPENSPLVIFEDIAERFGWYVSTLLYIPVVCLGAGVIYLPFSYFKKKAKVAVK